MGESLVCLSDTTMVEVRSHATCHIEAKEVMEKKILVEKKDVVSSLASKLIPKDYFQPKSNWSKMSDGRNDGSWRSQDVIVRPRVVVEVVEMTTLNTTRMVIVRTIDKCTESHK